MNFSTPITTFEQAKAFIEGLHAEGKMFHFEDSPDDIINGATGELLFPGDEASDVADRVAELYSMDWSEVGEECPIGYALTVMGEWAK